MRRLNTLRGRIICVAVVMLLALLLPVQAGGMVGLASAAAPRDGGNEGNGLAVVVIRNFGFHPALLTIQHDTTVLWINTDRVAHTVTADDGSFSSGLIRPGGIFVHTFNMDGHDVAARGGNHHGAENAPRDDGNGGRDNNTPLIITYHCSIHPFMHGAVIVND